MIIKRTKLYVHGKPSLVIYELSINLNDLVFVLGFFLRMVGQ